MSADCTGQPISWLRLERYHLGELSASERDSIAEHLRACRACSGCVERIEHDVTSALPPLPAATTRKRVARLRWMLPGGIVGTLAAAAAFILSLQRPAATPAPRTGVRVKGDAIAFSLVRDDGARIDGPDGAYRSGDRLKVLLTCPPGRVNLNFDVVVYDSGGASFPLAPAGTFACGNDRAVPGAFLLTGSDDETVCLVWNAGAAVDRGRLAELSSAPKESDGDSGASCKRLVGGPR
jgi:hypothetical protein